MSQARIISCLVYDNNFLLLVAHTQSVLHTVVKEICTNVLVPKIRTQGGQSLFTLFLAIKRKTPIIKTRKSFRAHWDFTAQETATQWLWGNCSKEAEVKPVYVWFLVRKYVQSSIWVLGKRLLLITKIWYLKWMIFSAFLYGKMQRYGVFALLRYALPERPACLKHRGPHSITILISSQGALWVSDCS